VTEDPGGTRPSRLSLRPLSQRRRPEGGPLIRPGSAPRLRPRAAPETEGAEAAVQRPTGDELFAAQDTGAPAPGPLTPNGADPRGTGADRPDAGLAAAGHNGSAQNGHGQNGQGQNGNGQNGHGQNGNGQNGRSRVPGPSRTSPENLPRRPAAVLPNRERTPIFDEVASVWFREAEPNDPVGVDPEWADGGHPGFDAGAPSLTAVDAGTTESGLPRRRPRAQLVPGSAQQAAGAQPPGGPEPATQARRDPDAVRGRLASYQRGVADGRSTRVPQPPDGGSAGEDPTNGPAHRAGPRTDEEEQ
jgi:hypothetical protein